MRKNISTHTPSEKRVGYSRAVILNDVMYISGTTSQDEAGEIIGKSLREQSAYIFQKIKKVLEDSGFTLNDVVIVRAFVIDLHHLTQFDEIFKKYFAKIQPTCTLIGVNSLVKENLLIEIEVTAQKE